MKSVPSSRTPRLLLLLPAVFPPIGALAAEVHASMEVSAQVVRQSSPAADAAAVVTRIEQSATAGGTDPGSIENGNECNAPGSTVMVNDVWATCSWQPDSRTYWVTIQY